ncbi:MAG: gluconate 2-dehydrogenase subunit 3 family protein [Burkholderiaceae bacterium]|nr:gluconate 2-dehydrogenase subunit 3 family protein [Burkholderiaceae bacterium]
MPPRVLDSHRADRLEALCEWIVPGSSHVGPAVYIDAVLASRPADARAEALRAIDALSGVRTAQALAAHERSAEFALVRALAIEAYYSDFVAPGREGPGAWAEIGFEPPRAVDLERDWSYLGIDRP